MYYSSQNIENISCRENPSVSLLLLIILSVHFHTDRLQLAFETQFFLFDT